jgi:hypothetical protein
MFTPILALIVMMMLLQQLIQAILMQPTQKLEAIG